MTNAETAYQHPLMQAYWAQLDTRFKQVEDVFEDVMAEALAILSREDIHHYLDAARVIGKLDAASNPCWCSWRNGLPLPRPLATKLHCPK